MGRERGPPSNWELFTGHWSGRGCHRLRIVRSGNCAATNDTHTESEGSTISYDFLEFILF